MCSKNNLEVRVKLCGNCNPLYDANKLLKELKQKYPDLKYVYSDEDDYDVYMIINGCLVSCISFPEINCPKILISGYSINRKGIDEDIFVDCVKEVLSKLINDEVV